MDDLKLFVDPVFTAKRISRCSVFWLLTKFTDVFLKRYPRAQVVCPIPDKGSRFEVDVDLNRPGWTFVPIPYAVDRYHEMFFPSDVHQTVFNEYNGIYGDWDVVLTVRENGAYFRNLISNTSQTVKFLALLEPFPQFEFKQTVCSGNKSDRVPITLRSASSYLDFDVVYMECDYERDSVIAESKNVLSASMCAALSRRLKVYFPTFPEWMLEYSKTEEAARSFIDSPKLQIMYTQRISTTQRQFDKVFKALSYTYSLLGDRISIFVCTNSSAVLPKYIKKDASFFVMDRPPRDEFHKLLKDSHLFLSFSRDEGLPKGLTEAFLLGNIGILYKTGWSLGMCGRDYPFFVNEPGDVYGIVKYVLENRSIVWETYQRWFDEWFLPNVLRKHPDMTLFVGDVEKHFNAQDLLCKGYTNPVGARILSSKHVGEEVDILHLDYPGFSQRTDLRTLRMKDTGYFLLPRRWVAHYWLRSVAGYRRTEKPWILRKSSTSAINCTDGVK